MHTNKAYTLNEFCSYGETMNSHGHPYLLRCIFAPDHHGAHHLEPAHRILWELIHGVPAPARVGHLRPVNGDWCDLSPNNWELVPLTKTRQEQADRKRVLLGGKTCTVCAFPHPIKMFVKGRNVCLKCYAERLRIKTNNRASHIKKFACQIVDGKHYHLVDKTATFEFWLRTYFRRVRDRYPDQSEYTLMVRRARLQLQLSVQLSKMEKNNGRTVEP